MSVEVNKAIELRVDGDDAQKLHSLITIARNTLDNAIRRGQSEALLTGQNIDDLQDFAVRLEQEI